MAGPLTFLDSPLPVGYKPRQMPGRRHKQRMGARVHASRRPGRRRRRRKPEEAQREILAAAEALLRERPFRELTVDELMARTGLSRPSFYEYFRDRHEVVMRLVESLGAELFPVSRLWMDGTGDPLEDLRRALDGVASVYGKHGPVLRALFEAAPQDRSIEKAYSGLIRRFIEAVARRIRADLRSGRTQPLDARETAAALVWVNERYLAETLGRTAPRTTPKRVAAVLFDIWARILYGRVA